MTFGTRKSLLEQKVTFGAQKSLLAPGAILVLAPVIPLGLRTTKRPGPAPIPCAGEAVGGRPKTYAVCGLRAPPLQ